MTNPLLCLTQLELRLSWAVTTTKYLVERTCCELPTIIAFYDVLVVHIVHFSGHQVVLRYMNRLENTVEKYKQVTDFGWKIQTKF